MSSVTIFIAKKFKNNAELEKFVDVVKTFGNLSKISGCGECGWTKTFNLATNNNDAPTILKLLKDDGCTCYYVK